jgi:5,10-methylenetetrahydromethanopterin reductase
LPEVSYSTDAREPVQHILNKAQAAYEQGVRTLWVANHLFQRDAATIAHAALARLPDLKIVLMAVNPFTQHPVQVAMTAATLDELFPGRVSLCLGVGAPVDLKSIGVEAEKPVGVMREAVQVIRALLSGEQVDFEGHFFQVRARSLANSSARVPIIVAASGPQMLELAGSMADGVLITAGSSVEFVKWCLEHVAQGADGRRVVAHGLVYGSIDDDSAKARARLRQTLGIVLRGAHHQRNLQLAGSALDQVKLNAAMAQQNVPAIAELLSDELIDRHSISGTPAHVRDRFAEYHAAGLDEIVLAGAKDPSQVSAILQSIRPAGSA